MVSTTALAIPLYLMFSKIGLTNSPMAIILPSLVSPFGIYLMRIYAEASVPSELIEAARIDGAVSPHLPEDRLPAAQAGVRDGVAVHIRGDVNNYFLHW